MKRQLYILLIFWGSLFLSSCDIGDNEIETLDPFLRIYDNIEFTSDFEPLDVRQTDDGFYIILAETPNDDSNFQGIYIMQADAEGNFISGETFDNQFVQAAPRLVASGGNFYFICMQRVSLQAHLVGIAPNGSTTAPIPLSDNNGNPLLYPMQISADRDGGLLFLGYDNASGESVFAKMNRNGEVSQSRRFTIGAGPDVDEPIIDHFTRTGRQLPFFTGVTSDGNYYFNGFFNFTFSLVMLDLNSDEEPSVLQGVQDESGLSSLAHLTGNTFAASRFSFGQNYILPQVEIDVASDDPGSSEDLVGNPFPELVPNAEIILKRMNVGGKEVLIYGSTTQGKQMVLMGFDASTGELLGTRYLGFSNPYTFANFTQTSDEGLAVVGTAAVAGRFSRICLFKLSPEDLSKLAGF
ncbi:MAG: hypothetical protein AAFU64_03190 [Bacteroidota bacterium]